jgi:hypothetical protein
MAVCQDECFAAFGSSYKVNSRYSLLRFFARQFSYGFVYCWIVSPSLVQTLDPCSLNTAAEQKVVDQCCSQENGAARPDDTIKRPSALVSAHQVMSANGIG